MPDGQIDSEIADAEWARNTQTQAPPVDRRGQQEDDTDVFGASQYTRRGPCGSTTRRASPRSITRSGSAKLVSGDEVKVAAFNMFRQFRDAMLNLPDRLAAMLAAETEAGEVLRDPDERDPEGSE